MTNRAELLESCATLEQGALELSAKLDRLSPERVNYPKYLGQTKDHIEDATEISHSLRVALTIDVDSMLANWDSPHWALFRAHIYGGTGSGYDAQYYQGLLTDSIDRKNLAMFKVLKHAERSLRSVVYGSGY